MIPSTEAAAPNRLARERSTYLRQHAHNPVDWRPWGDEALALARGEDKPILLSIGYSACHWCHVMAHESFEDPDVARLMNEWFVCIKVDREERPDLDQLYQGVVQLLGRGGGWPLTVFLTPDLRPFFGGTYFPREDRHGVIGFPRLLRALHDAWVDRRADVEEQSRDFATGLDHLAGFGLESAPRALQKGDLLAAARLLAREMDPRNGGFGGAPKFPSPMNVELLLRGYRRGGGRELLSLARLTLERMAQGGIYDQLGGGFHRYSVDAGWRVPHFEKMLYDNAQLLHLYSEAQQLEPRPLWRKIASETVEYVRREMTSPEGGFFASQDADSEGEEGKFFVWTPEELDRALPAELSRAAKLHFGVEPGGNFEGGASVLQARTGAAEIAAELGKEEAEIEAMLASARAILWREREERQRPGRDEKILAGWNGLMLRGLALASRAFGEPEWAALASRAADFVTRSLWDGRTLLRLYQGGPGEGEGLAEDYGALASGLLALFQATFEPRWLELASALVRRAGELFWDEGEGAYLSAPRDRGDLVARQYALHDGAVPSGGSSLAEAQLLLAALTGDPEPLARAGRYLERMADPMAESPSAFGHLWLAADAYLDGAPELTLVGDAEGRAALAGVFNRTYAPTVALLSAERGEGAPPILSRVLEGRGPIGGRAAAYLCRSFSCDRPVTSEGELEERLRALAG